MLHWNNMRLKKQPICFKESKLNQFLLKSLVNIIWKKFMILGNFRWPNTNIVVRFIKVSIMLIVECFTVRNKMIVVRMTRRSNTSIDMSLSQVHVFWFSHHYNSMHHLVYLNSGPHCNLWKELEETWTTQIF